ncbi:hypothetical protein GCM10009850_006800 [Nonomuraea monospora]|uniref:Secreted protein n=1 Tax=Nonomuraea monospora TaxID=568818 RepID=A0ABN3C792_9ACTN
MLLLPSLRVAGVTVTSARPPAFLPYVTVSPVTSVIVTCPPEVAGFAAVAASGGGVAADAFDRGTIVVAAVSTAPISRRRPVDKGMDMGAPRG